MFRAMMIVAAVSAGAWTAGSQANNRHSCCAPAADCCLASTCCAPGADCCYPGSDCCEAASCCTQLTSTVADEKKPEVKEVKLTGTLVCGACKLNESKKCANVLQVKEKDKTINYWLTDKGNDETYHEKICGGGELKDVTVTGVVSEKDGKKSVKTSKVEVK
jgi:hypothetical protein